MPMALVGSVGPRTQRKAKRNNLSPVLMSSIHRRPRHRLWDITRLNTLRKSLASLTAKLNPHSGESSHENPPHDRRHRVFFTQPPLKRASDQHTPAPAVVTSTPTPLRQAAIPGTLRNLIAEGNEAVARAEWEKYLRTTPRVEARGTGVGAFCGVALH